MKIHIQGEELIHLVYTEEENQPIIISMEINKNKKFQRVIIRTPQGDQRLLITTCGNYQKSVKILYNQCPNLSMVNIISFIYF